MTRLSHRPTGPARPTAADDGPRRVLTGWLRRPRYEVLSLPGTADLVEQHVPTALPVTVAVSPRRGAGPTLALAEDLSGRGYQVVPHLSARSVRGDPHLTEILHRLDAAGIGEVFVIGGDGARPAGTFPDAPALLDGLRRLRRPGAPSLRVGVAGYPEGHPLVDDAVLVSALLAKARWSSYAVTQLCFDADAVARWLTAMRDHGLRLPVQVGVAGAVAPARLARVAGRIGVGSSIRFLRGNRSALRLLGPGVHRPDRLIGDLAGKAPDPVAGVAGLHIYTLGEVAATERWRRELLDRLGEAGTRP